MAAEASAKPLMNAGNRERALRHAAECSVCAARLNAERALNAGLQALAEGDEKRKAPSHLKPALRAAFDQYFDQHSAQRFDQHNNHVTRNAPVLPFAPARSNWARWSLAAAAALILFAVAVALLSRNAQPNPTDMSGAGNTESAAAPPAPPQRPQTPPRVIESENRNQKVERHIAGKTSAPRRATASDDVTDYIPLTYLADATALESGMVIRVELSPSALIAMGAPAPMERSDSLVKADLIVGDDGVARAVRFVQQGSVKGDKK
jgi:hypothetical protein